MFKHKNGVKRITRLTPFLNFAQTSGFCRLDKSFGQAFSKACAVEARSLLALRRARNTLTSGAFSFASFSLCAYMVKEKSGEGRPISIKKAPNALRV